MTTQSRETILRATTVVTLLIFLGKAGGLLREILMVRSFEVREGALSATDAFVSALWLHLMLYNAWQHAFPHAYIPPLHRIRTAPAQRRLLWRTLTRASLILAVYVAGLLIGAPWIARIMAGGSDAPAEQVELTRHLLILTAAVGPLICLASIVKTHFNGLGRYTWPAAAMLPFSFGGALGLWLLADQMGIDALAVGTVAGAAAYLALVLWPLTRRPSAPADPSPSSPATTAPAAHDQPAIWRSFAGYFGSGLLLELDFLILLIVSRHLSPGFPTLLYLSMQLFNIFATPIDKGFSTSVFSQFSHHLHNPEAGIAKARSLLARGMTALLLCAAALSAASWWVAQPLAALLFERGAFGREDVRLMGLFAPMFFLSFFPAQGSQLVERLLAAVGASANVLRMRIVYQLCLVALAGSIVLLADRLGPTPWRMQLLLGSYALANAVRYVVGWSAMRRAGFAFERDQRIDVIKVVSAVAIAIIAMPPAALVWRSVTSAIGRIQLANMLELLILAGWFAIILTAATLMLRVQAAWFLIARARQMLSKVSPSR